MIPEDATSALCDPNLSSRARTVYQQNRFLCTVTHIGGREVAGLLDGASAAESLTLECGDDPTRIQNTLSQARTERLIGNI
jgi:hypothetical protein